MDRIIVVGGGIAGVSAALAMARTERRVTLCEQTRAFAPAGAGLTMAPSAAAGLGFLGVRDAFAAIAEPSRPPIILDWATGEALAPPATDQRHLGETRRILRTDLHAILTGALAREPSCELRFGARLVGYEQTSETVRACFDDGETVDGALLMGADGIKSRVLQEIGIGEPPQFTGYVAWRFLLPADVGVPHLDGRDVAITAGPDASLTCYTIGNGSLVNCVAIVRSDAWAEEGWSIKGDPAELADHFANAHPGARAIVAAAPADRLFKWALFDREPLPRWVDGRVVLLGDAAHPVLPFLGLGAGLAIEDAVVLARSLAAYPVEEAFVHYQDARAPRAALIQRMSRAQGEAFRSIGTARTTAPSPFYDRSLFDYDPTTVPI